MHAKTNKQVRYSSSRICVASSNWGQALNVGILDTTLIGLKCNGTENFLSDCPLDINFLHCSADSADANVVCPGI